MTASNTKDNSLRVKIKQEDGNQWPNVFPTIFHVFILHCKLQQPHVGSLWQVLCFDHINHMELQWVSLSYLANHPKWESSSHFQNCICFSQLSENQSGILNDCKGAQVFYTWKPTLRSYSSQWRHSQLVSSVAWGPSQSLSATEY